MSCARTRIAAVLAVLCAVAVRGAPEPPAWWAAAIEAGDLVAATQLPSDGAYVASVGNGYLAAIPTGDTLYVSGLFNGEGSKDPSHRARLPFQLGVSVDSASKDAWYALDVRGAAFHVLSEHGKGATVQQTWYAARHQPHVLVHDIVVNATQAANNVAVVLSVHNGTASSDVDLALDPACAGRAYQCWVGRTRRAEEPGGALLGVSVVASAVPRTVVVGAGTTAQLHLVMAVHTTLDTPEERLLDAAVASYRAAADSDAEALAAAHRDAWAALWEGGIEVGDNRDLAARVNTSLYYILSSVRDDWPYGLSPGSLASNAYNGHSFWDTETWMYPTTALLYQPLARSLLRYRAERVGGAEKKARSYTPPYAGAMYPWESALSGTECTPSWASTGQSEIHISADIVLAVLQYWNLTLDKAFVRDELMPMVRGTSTFWLSKAVYNSATGEYWITGVIPPDEYTSTCNNSAYTNYAAAAALRADAHLSQCFGNSTEREKKLLAVADRLRIPFDKEKRIHPEYDGYYGRLIKQADVVLLGYPLLMPMPLDVRVNDLKYYAERTDTNGPAMTHAMHAIAWIEAGNTAQAAAEFASAHEKNQKAPFHVWSETLTGGAVNFITGAGGFLQALWAGYGGVRVAEGALTIRPLLPPKTSALRLRGVQLLGGRLTIERSRTEVSITATAAPAAELCAVGTVDTTPHKLVVGKPVVYDATTETGFITISQCSA